jgi:hypothetical protein
MGRIGEVDEADVLVGDRVGPRQAGIVEERVVIRGRVVGAGRLVADDDLVVAEDRGLTRS